MKKLTRTLSVAQACVTMLSLVLFSMPSAAYATERNPEVEHKIDICHEGKVKNIDESGWNGHSDHPGDFIIDEGNPDHTSAKCTTPKVHDNGTLHVVKLIKHNELAHPQDFSFTVNGGTAIHFNSNGTNDIPKTPGTYSVAEVADGNYTTTYSSTDSDHPTDCNSLTISEEEDVTCTITNDYKDTESPQSCTLVSDATTYIGSAPAVPTFVHPNWTSIPGATWIWKSALANTSLVPDATTFTKTINVVGTPTSATLQIASDNTYSVDVNGVAPSCDGTSTDNFSSTDTCPISLHTGINTVTFVVTNTAGDTDPRANPAGLLYKISIQGASCGEVPPPLPTPTCDARTELLKNGSFEAPVVAAGDWNLFASGTPLLEWAVKWLGATVSGRPDIANLEVQSNGLNGWLSSAGLQWAELSSDWPTRANATGGASATTISQDIVTIPGKTYTFKFDASPRPGQPAAQNKIEALAGGLVIGTVGPTNGSANANNVWTPNTFSFVATSTMTHIELRDAGTPNDSLGPFVDNASLRCMPEVVTPPTKFKVHIFKYLQSGETTSQIPNSFEGPTFPMIATYAIAGVGSNLNPGDGYVLGNGGGIGGSDGGLQYAANTIPLSAGDTYGTHEVTGGSSVVVASSEQCSPNKYYLVGYQVGDTLSAAQSATVSATAPNFLSISKDEYVLVVNKKCAGAPVQKKETIVVTGNTAAGNNQLGWLFNRDATTATPFAFNTTAPDIGTGSLEVAPITNTGNGNADKFVGELFLLKAVSALSSISYDFKISAPNAAAKNQFYLNVYANFGESAPTKFYDCRYDVVPTIGSVAGFTTVTFDLSQSYPVTTRNTSPHTCPSSPAAMASIGTGTSTIRAIALNVGDTSAGDQGVGGFFDKVMVNSPALMTTYDFEPAPVRPVDMCSNIEGNQATVPEGMTADNGICTTPKPTVTTTQTTDPTNTSGGRSGSSRRGGGGAGSGQVLGASTTAGQVLGESCGLYLDKNLRVGSKKNDTEQARKIQAFLNKHLGAELPVTGFFGKKTEKALKTFQKQYAGDILTPWGIKAPTGIAYHTTLKKINEIECPELTLELPPLVDWSKNPNVQ